jgi:hypothetical protein
VQKIINNSKKNGTHFLAVLMLVDAQMQHGAHCPMMHIPGFTGSHWMLQLGEFSHHTVPAAAMVIEFGWTTKTSAKQNF